MNRTVLVGRLTKDPDLRYTNSGKAVANFTLAVNRSFKNAQGEQEADFIMCQIWGKPAESLANYMSKGSRIGVDGRIQTRNYENDQGHRVYVTEVVADNVQFLESKSEQQGQTKQQHQASYTKKEKKQDSGHTEPLDISDDDLPF